MRLNSLVTLVASVLMAALTGWLTLRADLENRLFLCLLAMLACHLVLSAATRRGDGCTSVFYGLVFALTGVGLRYLAQALGAPRGGMAAFSLVGAALGLWTAEPWTRGCWRSLLLLLPLAWGWLLLLARLDPQSVGMSTPLILGIAAYGAVMASAIRFAFWTTVGDALNSGPAG